MGPPEEPVAPERVQNNNNGDNIEIDGEPEIVNITDQNRHLINDSLGGMIVLPSGTLKLTPQFVTKQKNPDIQRMKLHARTPTTTPQCVRALDGHPQPSDLDLHWTHEGEWAKIPIERYTRLNKDSPHEIVRVESYIDEQGVIRKAVSYGRTDQQITVWYRYGDIQQYYPNWKIHRPSLFYNGKKWRDETPFFLNKVKKKMHVENNKKKHKVFIIQEGINLPKVDNKYYDFNNIMQKVNILLGDSKVGKTENIGLSNLRSNDFQEPYNRETSTQTMDMFVKNPKYYFGYHDISKFRNNNQNLRFSKNHNSKQNSKVKTQNTSSIHSKKKAGRIYPQENLKSG